MIYLVLTIIQSTLIFVTFKLFNRFRIDNLQAITTNYIVGAIFGYVIYESSCRMCEVMEANWIGMAVILGVLFIVVFNIFALSSQKVGVALTSVASKMSVVIPVALGIYIYKDRVNLMIIMGLITALLAFYLTLGKSNNKKVDRRLYILPILLFLGNGTVDSVMKYSQYHYITDDLMLFLVIVFITAFVIGLTMLTANLIKGKVRFRAKHILAGIILGLLNYGSTYYMIMSMATFDSAVVFPVVNVGIVGLSTLIGFFAFKEALNWVKWLGILLSLTAILLIAYA